MMEGARSYHCFRRICASRLETAHLDAVGPNERRDLRRTTLQFCPPALWTLLEHLGVSRRSFLNLDDRRVLCPTDDDGHEQGPRCGGNATETCTNNHGCAPGFPSSCGRRAGLGGPRLKSGKPLKLQLDEILRGRGG